MLNLKEYIDSRDADYYRFLKNMSSAESPTKDVEMVNLCGSLIKDFCKSEGIEVRAKEFAHTADYLELTVNGDGKGKPILLMAHFDTVHAVGSFGEDPVRVENGVIYGPGVDDCKGGVAAAIMAMKAIKECGVKRKVICILAAAEENSAFAGPQIAEYLTESSRGALCCMNLEPSDPGLITVGRKGIFNIKVEVFGKAAHAGAAYDKGVNAVKEAAHKIIEIESASDMNAVTYNCSLISGGSVSNTVPDYCSFVVDVRYPTAALMEKAMNRIQDICSRPVLPGARLQCTYLGKRPPLEHKAANDKLVDFINQVAVEIGYPTRTARVKGSGADSCYSAIADVPTVCSFGPYGGGAHTRRESCVLSSIPEQAYHIAEVIARIPEDF